VLQEEEEMFVITLHYIVCRENLCEIKISLVGQDSIVGIVTCYRLCSLGTELWWVRDFWYLSRLALEPTQHPVEWVLGSLSWREERVFDPGPPSSTEVKGRVKLYLWAFMHCLRVNVSSP
jgi:hypothetical protein